MNNVKFTLEKRVNENTGATEDALIKTTTDDKGVSTEEQWLTVPELDRLFDTCSRRWSENGWDLEKLLVCINECAFD
jgi:hypothetical protein